MERQVPQRWLRCICTIAALCILAGCAPQPGDRIDVPGDYSTITQALRNVKSGVTIDVAPGTYSTKTGEEFPLVPPVSGIELAGQGSIGDVIIDNDTRHPTIVSRNGATIRWIRFRTTDERLEYTIDADATRSLTLDHCIFEGAGVSAQNAGDVAIRSCIFAPEQRHFWWAIDARGSADVWILRNTIVNYYSGGVFLRNTVGAYVEENIIDTETSVLIDSSTRSNVQVAFNALHRSMFTYSYTGRELITDPMNHNIVASHTLMGPFYTIFVDSPYATAGRGGRSIGAGRVITRPLPPAIFPTSE